MKQAVICGASLKADGPKYRCTRKAIWTFIGRRGHRYSVCSYHAKDLKDDPRLVRKERVK